MSGASVLRTPLGWSVGWSGRLVGCLENSLTVRFLPLPGDLPQVKRGTSHSRSEAVSRTGRRFVRLGSREWRHGSEGTPREVRQVPPSRSPLRRELWPTHDGQGGRG